MSNQYKSNLSVLRNQRLEKIVKLKKLGFDPYPSSARKSHYIDEIINNYDEYKDKYVYLTGRLMSIREHGQLIFGNIQDFKGKIQLYIKKEVIKPRSQTHQYLSWDELNLLDIGDFIQAEGNITKTSTGEISILVKRIKILTKSIRPLPDKWKSITDKEARYRRRYLDLTMNKDVRDVFKRKSMFWELCREFLKKEGFIEVETPVLELKTGGADAKPFITHHNDLNIDLYMRISTELYQKRLIGGGYEKIFTLGPNFRNEGVDDEHTQEYTALEWYYAYANYEDNMRLTKDLYRFLALKIYGKTEFTSRGHTFDLSNEWEEIDYVDVIKGKFGIDIFKDSDEKMLEIIKNNNIKLSGVINRNRLIDNLWKLIRKEISGPAFLINEPKFMSPLAKSKKDNPELTERFHIILAGSELGNGYSEINDPIDQLQRFMEQEKARIEGDDESQMLDIDFVEMLEYGMPPTSGFGFSERLFWFLEDISAREGTLFPLMKIEVENTTKEIYPEVFSASKKIIKAQDFSKKIVLVLKNDLEGWQLTNTIAHLSTFIGSKIKGNLASREYFDTKDKISIPSNTQYPIITLSGKESQLFKLIEDIKKEHLDYLIYTDDMIKFTDDTQLAKYISMKTYNELKILGISIFGDKEKINSITKRFSLWK